MTATTTTTATATGAHAAKETNPQPMTRATRARFAGPPAIDHEGKPIPHSSRWGYSAHIYLNSDFYSFLFMASVIGLFIAFNTSQMAYDFYKHLEQTYTPFQINSIGTFLISTVVYYVGAGLFAILDLTGRPRFLFKYKVQPFQRVSGEEYWQITKIVIRNQVFVVIPLVLFKGKYLPNEINPDALPGPWKTLAHLIFNVMCTEVGFYFIHRAFHSPMLYTRFHKQHHYVTAPVAMAATYCTMTEHLFSNLLPNALGTSILRPHWSVQLFTFCYLEISTLCAHSGYNFPGMYSSLKHDWHHFSFTENFGPLGILDSLLGTDKRFVTTVESGVKRHRGDRDKARDELLSKLAHWESDRVELS